MTRLNTFSTNSFLCLLAASSLFFASCKKGGDNNDGDGKGDKENTFTIDGTTYEATQISYISDLNILRAQRITPTSGLNEVESLSITFSDDEFPTTGGSFDVVQDPYSPGDKTNNNQVSITASTFPHMNGSMADDFHYYPKFSPVQHINVTISGNTINVKFSDLHFQDQDGKDAAISANITLAVDN